MSDPSEHDQDSDRIFDDAARLWLAGQETRVSRHPQIDTLIAFQEGRLRNAEAERVGTHVEGCEACQDELSAFQAFDDTESGAAHGVDEEATHTASWRAFEARRELDLLEGQQPSEARRREGEVVSFRRLIRRPGTWMALAAVLIAAVGVASFVWTTFEPDQNAEIARLTWPAHLLPEGTSLRRSAEDEVSIPVPGQADRVLAVLRFGDQADYDGFLAELYDAGGNIVLTTRDVYRDELGRFLLTLPRDLLENRVKHRIVLYGLPEGAEPVELASYVFRVHDAD